MSLLRQAWILACLPRLAQLLLGMRFLAKMAQRLRTRGIHKGDSGAGQCPARRDNQIQYQTDVVDPDSHIDSHVDRCVCDCMKKRHYMLAFGCQNYSEDVELLLGHESDCPSPV